MWFVFTQEINFIVCSLTPSSCCRWYNWFCQDWNLKRNVHVLLK